MNPSDQCQSVILQSVSKAYREDGGTVHALDNASAEFRRGRLALMLGPSGSGKTTLLSLIAGFTEPTSGEVKVFDTELARLRPSQLQLFRAMRIGFVFQNFLLLDWLTVRDNVAIVAEFARRDGARTLAKDSLERVGILHLADRFPSNLSQGEKQRVAIARACVNNPQLLLADEPTASLDSKQGFEIIKILRSIAKEENRCVIAASHDLRLIEYADDIFRIEDGELKRETRPPTADHSSTKCLQVVDKKSSAAAQVVTRT